MCTSHQTSLCDMGRTQIKITVRPLTACVSLTHTCARSRPLRDSTSLLHRTAFASAREEPSCCCSPAARAPSSTRARIVTAQTTAASCPSHQLFAHTQNPIATIAAAVRARCARWNALPRGNEPHLRRERVPARRVWVLRAPPPPRAARGGSATGATPAFGRSRPRPARRRRSRSRACTGRAPPRTGAAP